MFSFQGAMRFMEVFGTAVAGSTVIAGGAGAAPSGSVHALPNPRVAGVTQLCGPRDDYACTGAGYRGQNDGWPGRKYGGQWPSRNAYGPHNCTLYAAYRAWKNGAADPGWSANANGWDTA